MTNIIKKTCPECGYEDSDILASIMTSEIKDKKTERISWNLYRCMNPKGRKHQFRVKRTKNLAEQELTRKYIDIDK